ncbi:uncharacterized protein LOC34623624 [Cyclospora cayetanensis]|uniref:Uncharacterized protein LOC34623624 n=1 Tax=Cyclospora cayetanensis TaxID=88456 RepID=A0A6P6S0T0_9EIME|nr:uncharacterized protein LOC34623624 [Cyclospora cayetanensis]
MAAGRTARALLLAAIAVAVASAGPAADTPVTPLSQVDKLPIDEETYDFIIVGGGAAGCAVADVLSQSGRKVLLLERGMERSLATTPNAMSARGAGIGLADATISQAVGTVQGVRTFSGALMGGGSAINLGIVIGETEEYFREMARQFPGYNIDYTRLKTAYDYVAWKLARAMPVLPPFGLAYKNALTESGFKNWGGGDYPEPSLIVRPGYQWVGYSLFDAGNNLQRNAADALIEATPNLTIKTRHTVRSVTFVDTPDGKVANCVLYRPTKYKDIRPIDWAPWVGSFLEPTSVLAVAGVEDPKKKLRRVCLTDPGTGRIVLSAGAVHTPLVLYRSGIGPAAQLGLLKVPQVLDNPAVGSSFSDRVFLAIPGFLKHYVDAIPLINPSKNLRRLAADEEGEHQKLTKLRLVSKPTFEPILTIEELEKVITPETREAVLKILDKPLPTEVFTIDEDDESVSTRFEPPVLLPDLLMFPGKLQYLAPALQPRVCQFMGLKQIGPHCRPNDINQRNLGCSLVAMEELSGDRTAEGFIYASRYMFPTMFRKDPILDAVTEILQACSNYRAPFGLVVLKPLCVLAQPVVKCLRKAVAPFYFTSEPKSRGSIRLKPTGEVVVDPQYLVHEQDLFDAVRGVATLVDQINGDSYKGILQAKGSKSCPLVILNGLLDILLTLASTASPFLTHSKNFAEIQRYLQDLIPPESRRLRRLVVVDESYHMKPAIYEDSEGNEYEDYSAFVEEKVDEAKIEALGVKRRLEAVGFDFDSYRAHISGTDASARDSSPHLGAISRRLDAALASALGPQKMEELMNVANSIISEEALKANPEDPALKSAIEDCKKSCSKDSIENHTCAQTDICCAVHGNSKCIRTPGQPSLIDQQNGDVFSNADAAENGGTVKTEEFLSPLFGLTAPTFGLPENKQWAATFPPKLPSSHNPKALAKFALSYMTSIGHTYGSAPMGKVVDDKFQVMGVNGLSIVDGSVLPQLTRMNPVYTIMALGR